MIKLPGNLESFSLIGQRLVKLSNAEIGCCKQQVDCVFFHCISLDSKVNLLTLMV